MKLILALLTLFLLAPMPKHTVQASVCKQTMSYVIASPTPTEMPTPEITATPAPIVAAARQIGYAEATQSYMLSLVNQVRAENGLRPLIELQVLDTSAAIKAADMTAQNYFSHTRPNGQFFSWSFREAGFTNYGIAENLGRSYPDDNSLFQAFMNSPEHRENILEPKAVYFGFARNGIYGVMHFGGAY